MCTWNIALDWKNFERRGGGMQLASHAETPDLHGIPTPIGPQFDAHHPRTSATNAAFAINMGQRKPFSWRIAGLCSQTDKTRGLWKHASPTTSDDSPSAGVRFVKPASYRVMSSPTWFRAASR